MSFDVLKFLSSVWVKWFKNQSLYLETEEITCVISVLQKVSQGFVAVFRNDQTLSVLQSPQTLVIKSNSMFRVCTVC